MRKSIDSNEGAVSLVLPYCKSVEGKTEGEVKITENDEIIGIFKTSTDSILFKNAVEAFAQLIEKAAYTIEAGNKVSFVPTLIQMVQRLSDIASKDTSYMTILDDCLRNIGDHLDAQFSYIYANDHIWIKCVNGEQSPIKKYYKDV